MSQPNDHHYPIPKLPTTIPGVELRELTGGDSTNFYNLVSRNRVYLTQNGDYEDLVKLTRLEIEEIFSSPADFYLRMGIWKGEELMGQVDLNQAAPGVFVLGYWLGEKYTGHGYMTAACCAVMNYARRTWPVKEFWAGVRHANVKSAAVVDRLGFAIYEELPDRKRYRLICD